MLSLERHHGVRAGRQLDCMVGEVQRADVRRRPALEGRVRRESWTWVGDLVRLYPDALLGTFRDRDR